jgi:cytochrome c biogenesis protein CcmG, thiol:disulfide interchange protein DsbE
VEYLASGEKNMLNTKKILFLLPFIILLAFFILLWRGLFYTKPHELPSTLIGKSLPAFSLPNLYEPKRPFTPKDLNNKVSLLNIWATWCAACIQEMPFLMKIKQDYHVPIYSIDYKDSPTDAKKWLAQFGNPYVSIGSDTKGDTAIDLGVYGTPETYVIAPDGKIIYRHIGVLNQQAWDENIAPLIKQYTENPYPFTNAEDALRFTKLTNETRCVVCQNQSIADSNAPLAKDLREKIHQFILEKKSNEEIENYLVNRYGEFILLRPRINKLTIALWAFPFAAIFLPVIFIFIKFTGHRWRRGYL